jgi:hypothetical protein
LTSLKQDTLCFTREANAVIDGAAKLGENVSVTKSTIR